MGHFFVREITTNTMPPAVERIKQYSSTVTLERAEQRAAKADKSGSEKMRERVEKHEASNSTAKKSNRAHELKTEGDTERGGAVTAVHLQTRVSCVLLGSIMTVYCTLLLQRRCAKLRR